MEKTAVSADFVNVRPVYTRGKVQLIFEIDQMELIEALKILGQPELGKDLFCGIARLNK